MKTPERSSEISPVSNTQAKLNCGSLALASLKPLTVIEDMLRGLCAMPARAARGINRRDLSPVEEGRLTI